MDLEKRIFSLSEYKHLFYAYSLPFRINRRSQVKKGARVAYLCDRALKLLNDVNLWEQILLESIRDPGQRPRSLPMFIRRIRFIICETALRGILTIHKVKAKAVYEEMEEIFLKKNLRLYSTGADTSKIVITLPKKKKPQTATEVAEPQAVAVPESGARGDEMIDGELENVMEQIRDSLLNEDVQPAIQSAGRRTGEIVEPSHGGKSDEDGLPLAAAPVGFDIRDFFPRDSPIVADFFSRLEDAIIERQLEDERAAKVGEQVTDKMERRDSGDDIYKIEPYAERTIAKLSIERRVGAKTHEVDMSRFMQLVSTDRVTGSQTFKVAVEIHPTPGERRETDLEATEIGEIPRQDTVDEDDRRKAVPLVSELPATISRGAAVDVENLGTLLVIEPSAETMICTLPERGEQIPVVEELRQRETMPAVEHRREMMAHTRPGPNEYIPVVEELRQRETLPVVERRQEMVNYTRPKPSEHMPVAEELGQRQTLPAVERSQEMVTYTRPELTEFVHAVDEQQQHRESKRPRLSDIESKLAAEDMSLTKIYSDRKISLPTKTIKDYFQPIERVLESEVTASKDVPEINIMDATLDVPASEDKRSKRTSSMEQQAVEKDAEDDVETEKSRRRAVFFRDVFKKENLFLRRRVSVGPKIMKKVAYSKRALKNWFSRDALDKKYESAALAIDAYEEQIPSLYGPYYMIHGTLNDDFYYIESNEQRAYSALIADDSVYPSDERSLDEMAKQFDFLKENIDDISFLGQRKAEVEDKVTEKSKAEQIVDDALRKKPLSPYAIRRPLSDYFVKPVDISEEVLSRKSSALAPVRMSEREDMIGSARFSDIPLPIVEPLRAPNVEDMGGIRASTASVTSRGNEQTAMVLDSSCMKTSETIEEVIGPTIRPSAQFSEKQSSATAPRVTDRTLVSTHLDAVDRRRDEEFVPRAVIDPTIRPPTQFSEKRSSDVVDDAIPRVTDRTVVPAHLDVVDLGKEKEFGMRTVIDPMIRPATQISEKRSSDVIDDAIPRVTDRTLVSVVDSRKDEEFVGRTKKLLPANASSLMDRIEGLLHEKTASSVTQEEDDTGGQKRKGPILFSELCPIETTSRFIAAKTFGLLLHLCSLSKKVELMQHNDGSTLSNAISIFIVSA